jgi:tetratricopeptide (TPR) repeat protein
MKQKPFAINRLISWGFLFALPLSIFLFGCQVSSTETPLPPILPDEITNDAESYLARGDYHADAQKWENAIAQYDQVLLLNPNFAEAYNNRGYAYYWNGDATRAIADYTQAIQLRSR